MSHDDGKSARGVMEIEDTIDEILAEMEANGPEILVVRLTLPNENESCMGENVALLYTRVLERISEMVGVQHTACLRDFAARIAAIRLCSYHWTPIDRMLRQLITIWKTPIQ